MSGGRPFLAEPAGPLKDISPPIEQARPRPEKKFRALVGAVEMLGGNWLHEQTAWKRKLLRTRSLSKLAIKIGLELAMAVDREQGSANAGFAVRTHGWLARELASEGARRKVQEALSELVNLGFLAVECSKREGAPNRYALRFPDQVWEASDDETCPF